MTTSSDTLVAPVVSNRSVPAMTFAFSPVPAVVFPRSKSGLGKIGSP